MVYDKYVPEVTDYRVHILKCERGGRGTIISERFCGEKDAFEVELAMIESARDLAKKETDENVTVYSTCVEKVYLGGYINDEPLWFSEKIISIYNAYCD